MKQTRILRCPLWIGGLGRGDIAKEPPDRVGCKGVFEVDIYVLRELWSLDIAGDLIIEIPVIIVR